MADGPVSHVLDATPANWTTDSVAVSSTANRQVNLNILTLDLRTGQESEYVAHSQLGLGMKPKFHASLSIAKNIASRTYSFF
jgi:hypothetical protein